MVVGRLVYNGTSSRYSIVNPEEEIDLHCGYVFEYQNKYGEWITARIEMGENGWYLIGADMTLSSIEHDCREYDRKVRIDR